MNCPSCSGAPGRYIGTGMLPDPNKVCACAPLTPAGVFNGVPCAPTHEQKEIARLAVIDLNVAAAADDCCNLIVKNGAALGVLALPQSLPLANKAVMKGRELPTTFVSQRGAADCSLKTMMIGAAASARSAKPQYSASFGSLVERKAGAAIAVADNGCAVQDFGQQGPTSRMGWKLAACGVIPSTIGWSFGPQICAVTAPAVSGCTPPGAITNFVSSDLITPVPSPYEAYAMYFDLTWDPVPGASYTLTSDFVIDLTIVTGNGTGNLYIPVEDYTSDRTITLTATTECGSVSTTTTIFPCFLAGSLVAMADGTSRVIEDIQVGDLVVGAFGEINEVLALHRPLLGACSMYCINDEHSTTIHHPHIGANKVFYSGNPDLVRNGTYGRTHKVIDASGELVDRMLYGVAPERIQQLELGVELKTLEGSRIAKSLEIYSMPEDTQLYNLVVGGSHTYHVDGYAVTGWPREDDFNYDLWTSI